MPESKAPSTRREARELTAKILGQYHDLLMTNDLAGFEKLLEVYNVAEELREEQRQEFMHYAERILQRRWRGPRWS
jgi:hypothetical protein